MTEPRSSRRRGAREQNLLFLALGRRGAIPRLALQLALASAGRQDLRPAFVVSRGSELFGGFAQRHRVVGVDTIDTRSPASFLRNYFQAERRILDWIAFDRPDAVVNLCPHIWSPVLMRRIRRLNVPFVTVLHDAVGHPGDAGALLAPWFRREARGADAVVTLSQSVANALAGYGGIAPERIVPLFLPDLIHDAPANEPKAARSGGFRLLHFGRLLKYKRLDLLLDALEIVARGGIEVALTVAGAGRLATETRERLANIKAEVVNRWIGDAEIGPLFSRHDALVLSHQECSQSGSAAAAFGNALPVVAVPVGGLVEQVIDGRTGVLASAATARALAAAILRLAGDADLHAAISSHLATSKPDRSTQRFLDVLLARKPWHLPSLSGEAA